ncbi:unnamed protein product [Sphenostylis stenocarpa]|uniref:Uncharacterized protein n=1 Tax=Sphenostylis stenocarpa TaxID=92480 RepID=A0AA86S169_9FABA|nr:unnamed protein product [Sphenostylis stenocarpa]
MMMTTFLRRGNREKNKALFCKVYSNGERSFVKKKRVGMVKIEELRKNLKSLKERERERDGGVEAGMGWGRRREVDDEKR